MTDSVQNGGSGEFAVTGDGEGVKGKVQTKNFSETYAVFDISDVDAIATHIKDKLVNSNVKDANIVFKMKLIVAE